MGFSRPLKLSIFLVGVAALLTAPAVPLRDEDEVEPIVYRGKRPVLGRERDHLRRPRRLRGDGNYESQFNLRQPPPRTLGRKGRTFPIGHPHRRT